MTALKTDEGRTINIDSFYMTLTYGGMLEGVPTREGNEKHVEHTIPHNVKKLWGSGRKIHVVKPHVEQINGLAADALKRYENPERFPRYECYAWLTCSQPLERDADGSHAFLVWWTHDLPRMSTFEEWIGEPLKGLRWTDIAKDYDV